MIEVAQLLGIPFLACLMMAAILGYFGHHVLKREIIFVDIALAQVAAVGSIFAHVVFAVHDNSLAAFGCSLGCVLVAAAFYAYVRQAIVQISLEAVIGVSYAIAAAAALFLVGVAVGGHIHIQKILAGSLLWAQWSDLGTSLLVFSAIGACLYLVRKPLAKISEGDRQGGAAGPRAIALDFLFYALLGVVITLAVRIAGIVVVFSYLVMPATAATILCQHQTVRLIITWLVAFLASLAGLLFAYWLDFSVGPAIALFLGIALIIAGGIGQLRQRFTLA